MHCKALYRPVHKWHHRYKEPVPHRPAAARAHPHSSARRQLAAAPDPRPRPNRRRVARRRCYISA
jgi:hypothetical protein